MELTRRDVIYQPMLLGGETFTHLVSTHKHQRRRPIVLLHGMGGGAWYWEEWVHYFTVIGGYPTTAPDFPGHGRMDHVDNHGMGLEEYIHYIQLYIKYYVLPENKSMAPIIIGHSMGGLVAQKLGELGVAHALVLIAPAPPKTIRMKLGRDFIVPIRDFPDIIRSFTQHRPFIPSKKFLSSLFINPTKSKKMIERCADLRVYESPKVIWQLLNSSLEVDSSLVTVPMLIIGFEQDHIIAADVVRLIAERYPQADLHIRKDLGHLCPLEHGWKKVIRKCLVWIDKHS